MNTNCDPQPTAALRDRCPAAQEGRYEGDGRRLRRDADDARQRIAHFCDLPEQNLRSF